MCFISEIHLINKLYGPKCTKTNVHALFIYNFNKPPKNSQILVKNNKILYDSQILESFFFTQVKWIKFLPLKKLEMSDYYQNVKEEKFIRLKQCHSTLYFTLCCLLNSKSEKCLKNLKKPLNIRFRINSSNSLYKMKNIILKKLKSNEFAYHLIFSYRYSEIFNLNALFFEYCSNENECQ